MLLHFTNSLGKSAAIDLSIFKWILKFFGPPHLGTKIRLNLLKKTLKKLNIPRYAEVLDAGSGYGFISLFLAQKNFQVTAIDMDNQRLKVAKTISELFASKSVFIKANVYHLPFKSSSFDLCICFEVLEHLKDDQKAIKELARVLKKGSYLVLSVPEFTSNQNGIDQLGHSRPGYTISQLKKTFQEKGINFLQLTPIGSNFWGKTILNIDFLLAKTSPFLSAIFAPILSFLCTFEHIFTSKSPPYSLFVVFQKKG